MQRDVTGFDGALQMFREPPRPVSLAHLRFLRWLAEHDRLEQRTMGVPSGVFAERTAADKRPTPPDGASPRRRSPR